MRWFFPEALGDRASLLQRWLALLRADGTGTFVQGPGDWREDHYLVLPGTSAVGIKCREGRLEIKGRLTRDGVVAFGTAGTGCIEGYAKWSVPGAALAESLAQRITFAGSGMIPVRKRRWLWTSRLAVADGSESRQLQVEVTRLQSGSEVVDRWWTLGIEASPLQRWPLDGFTSIVTMFLATAPIPELRPEMSMGYAGWLAGQGDTGYSKHAPPGP
ncbi:MAG: hypothetical protein EA406_13995 [Rhodospirillales bacterium]|nr:MAG: hypothetical protein EA406_13995 [Rhodospirillales bacterium]